MRHHAALTFGERRRASRRPTFVTEIVEYFLGLRFTTEGRRNAPFEKDSKADATQTFEQARHAR